MTEMSFSTVSTAALWTTAARHVGAAVSLRRVKLLRRALLALSLASLIAGSLRLRGKGGVPPQEGGWREMKLPPS